MKMRVLEHVRDAVDWAGRDFCFLQLQDSGTYFMKPREEGEKMIVEMFTDYEGGGALSLAQDFLLISFSYDFNFTAGTKDYLEEIKLNSLPAQKQKLHDLRFDVNGFQLDKIEIWITNKNVPVSRVYSGLDLK